jgi:putative transposase
MRSSGFVQVGVYYQAVSVSAKDLELMRQIDEIHLAWSFYGSRKIRDELCDWGYVVGRRPGQEADASDGH